MIKILVRLISCFIPFRKQRRAFRNKYLNKFSIHADKSNIIDVPKNRNIRIYVDGKHNFIKISKNLNVKSNIEIFVYGDHNSIQIGDAFVRDFVLAIGGEDDNRQVKNANFYFGNSYAWQINIIMQENETKVSVGNDCMISNGVEFHCTDDHTIIDSDGNVLNKAHTITVGNHVWICKDVLILKNSMISDNSIVGAKSVIAKCFTEQNVVIAGNPAKIVKTGTNWNGERADLYQKNVKEPKISMAVESNFASW